MYSVYTLAHPLTGDIKYVGSTKFELNQRLIKHKSPTSINFKRNAAKMEWVLHLLNENAVPKIELIETFDNYQDALNSEMYWTEQFKAWGFDLLNIYSGKKMAYSSKMKMHDLKVGKPVSEATLKASNEKRKKSVVQLSKESSFIREWEYIIQAGTELRIDRGDITKACKNKNKTAGGFKWIYKEEYLSQKTLVK